MSAQAAIQPSPTPAQANPACEMCRARVLGLEAMVSGIEEKHRVLSERLAGTRQHAAALEDELGRIAAQLASTRQLLAWAREESHDRR